MRYDGGIVLGMAGLAEAAEGVALMAAYTALVLVGIATLIAFTTTSRIPLGIAVGLLVLTTLLFMPWRALLPLTAHELEDPDMESWTDSWRLFAGFWFIAVIAVTGAVFSVNLRRSIRGNASTSEMAGRKL